MKSFGLAVLIFFISLNISKSNEEEIIFNKIANDVCIELNKISISESSGEELKTAFGFSIITNSMKYKNELAKFGYELDDAKNNDNSNAEKIGKKVGEILLVNCNDKFIELVTKIQKEEQEAEVQNDISSMDVTFDSIKNEIISTIITKGLDGRTYNFLWLNYFEGSEYLLANKAALKNKKMKITYYESDIYSSAINDYFRHKIISKIEFE